jgi:hypothetical protein
MTAIQEWARLRFDFEFGCEISNSIKDSKDDAPEGQVAELAEYHSLPADGIRRVVVATRHSNASEDWAKIVTGIWMYDDADELIMEFNKSLDESNSNENRTITSKEFILNEGERIIGIRGDDTNESVDDEYTGFWMALEFLVSDGPIDRVLTTF